MTDPVWLMVAPDAILILLVLFAFWYLKKKIRKVGERAIRAYEASAAEHAALIEAASKLGARLQSLSLFAQLRLAQTDAVQRCKAFLDIAHPAAGKLLHMASLLVPQTVVGSELIRVGRQNDGGYLMVNEFAGKSVAYSFGICDDVSWDSDVAARGLSVYMYDHTIEALPEVAAQGGGSAFHWFKTGICGSTPALNCKTLPQILTENGHDSCRDLTLKMDVEGAEWDAIGETPSAVWDQFNQIVLEMHWLTDTHRTGEYIAHLEKLLSTHALVAVHANNHSGYLVAGNTVIPDVIECLFVRRRDHQFAPGSPFLAAMDQPCNRGLSEIPRF